MTGTQSRLERRGTDLRPAGAALPTLAWVVITVFAVQKWFRGEPRREGTRGTGPCRN